MSLSIRQKRKIIKRRERGDATATKKTTAQSKNKLK